VPTNTRKQMVELAPAEVVYPQSLLDAVTSVDGALQLSPDNGEALGLVALINVKSQEYLGYVFRWLIVKNSLYQDRQSRDEFNSVKAIVSKLCFDTLRQLNESQRSLVQELMMLCLEWGDDGAFKGLLTFEKPFTRSGGGDTSPPPQPPASSVGGSGGLASPASSGSAPGGLAPPAGVGLAASVSGTGGTRS
jgi:hypothetical protein